MKNSIYNVFHISGIRRLTKLRLEFSELNAHRFPHNFDCLSPFCSCGMANEDNEHFLLHCQRFDLMRIDVLQKLSDISGLDISKLNAKTLCEMLLYGNPHLNIFDNRIVFCFVRYKSARSCHLSVLRMNQSDELATKRVFGVITLLTIDYLFSCRFNSFLSSYR